MVDMIVELENNNKYLILDETLLKMDKNSNKDIKYYFGLKLDQNEEPTNNYLFFEEIKEDNDTFLSPINDRNIKDVLLMSFTVNFLDMVYDEI